MFTPQVHCLNAHVLPTHHAILSLNSNVQSVFMPMLMLNSHNRPREPPFRVWNPKVAFQRLNIEQAGPWSAGYL